MSYVRSQPRPTFLIRDRNNDVSIQVQEAGAAVTPAAATYTLRETDGTAIVSAAAGTPGTTSTYTITSDLTSYAYASTLTEEWALTIAGTVHRFFGSVVLCRVEPFAPITEDDLIAAHSDLSRSTMLPEGKFSWQPYIDRALDSLIARLMRTSTPPHTIVDWFAFHDWMEARALWNIAMDLMVIEGGDGKWTALTEVYERLTGEEWDRLGFKVDRDNDAVIDTDGATLGNPSSNATGLHGRVW